MEKYPEDLPEIPIYNDLETCVNCTNVWLDPISEEPDFNHCIPMTMPEYSTATLTAQQLQRLSLINTKVQCPLYAPKSDKGPRKLA